MLHGDNNNNNVAIIIIIMACGVIIIMWKWLMAKSNGNASEKQWQ
jgi:hypothetical protein